MEDQLEEFRQDQLEKYLDETSTEDISADDLITWFQNNQLNTNHQFNNTAKMNFNSQDRGHKNFHPYESPSSTTNSMEQRVEYDTHNAQHSRGNIAGQSHTIRENKESNITPNVTNNFVQTAAPVPEQNFIQSLFHIKGWEKIDLPGQIDPNLTKIDKAMPINCNTNLLSVNPTTYNYEQTQWQTKQPIAPTITHHNTQENLGNNAISIIIDNQQPFQINEDIVTQIKNQASGVRQVIKFRNPDPEPEVHRDPDPEPKAHTSTSPAPLLEKQCRNPDPEPEVHRDQNPEPKAHTSTSPSPILEKHPPVPLKTTHKPKIIKQIVKTSSRKGKSRHSKSSSTKEKVTTIISPHKRSTRNITTSKYAKLRSILEKLEDQETSPSSPTSQAKKSNRTLHDFQVEVAAINKNDMSRMISKYNIHKKTSPTTQ